ncbi:MAG TPA: AMP-binding protein, partial [Gemmatimonadaceae bacterium]
MTALLQEYATQQASRRPDATALAFKSERTTYGELERDSNRLANLLRESGVRRGDRVCMLMPKSTSAVIAMHGILKAGAIYVPLDPASPAPRLEKMITACDDRWILASGPVGRTLDTLFESEDFAAHHSLGWLGAGDPPALARPSFTWDDVIARPSFPIDPGTATHDPA